MGNKQNTTKKQSQVLKFSRLPPQQQQTPEQQFPSSRQLGEILLQLTSQGDASKVKNLLDQGADKNYLNQGGQSPMYIALAYGHADLFQILYLQGAQIIPAVEYNGSPLHAAVKFGHQELCQLLLQENSYYPEYQNMKDDRGYTPLHLACLKGNINLVKLLLRAKAQIEVRGKDGKTPLSICIENMHKDIQSLLESSLQKSSIVENNHLTHKRDISSIMLESAENNQENLQNYLEKKLNDSSSYLPVIPAKELTYLDQINKGSSCLLYRGRWRQSEVAIKQFKIEYSQGKKELKKFIKELSVLMTVRHPHLLLLMGVSIDGPNLCLITEYVDNNTLFYALHKNKKRKLTSPERLKIAIQIAKGMLYLHYNEPPIVHRDLKPENCLLDRAYNVKIADFGLARPLIYLQGEEQENTTTCIGTTRFMAPELFDKKFTQLSPEVDVWSYGCLMIEIFSNKRPWSHISSANTNCIYYEIFKKKPVPIPETIDLPLRDLIRKCLSYEPQERPNMEIILLALESYAEQIKSAN